MTNEIRLIPRNLREANFPIARFLSNKEQEIYQTACTSYEQKAKNSLNVPINGSNLWKVLLLNKIGIRTTNLFELETALENGLDLRGTYTDTSSVILRSNEDSYSPNNYIIKDLTKKLKLNKIKTPMVINGLTLSEDNKSNYGLVLEPTSKTEIIEAPDFSFKNNQRKFNRINQDYNIEFSDKGNRTFYTRNKGLSRLDLSRDLYLDSYWDNLADSGSSGRVVVIDDAKGVASNINTYLNKLKTERNKQVAEIDARFKKAEATLRGK